MRWLFVFNPWDFIAGECLFHCSVPQHVAQYVLIPPIRLYLGKKKKMRQWTQNMWKHDMFIKEGMGRWVGGRKLSY